MLEGNITIFFNYIKGENKKMKDKSLLASVALFRELYNSDNYKNVETTLGEFISGAVVFSKKSSLTSYEIKNLLKDIYEFDIPEGVVKTVTLRVLKDYCEFNKTFFNFNDKIKSLHPNIENELLEKNAETNTIFAGLKKYICEESKQVLTPVDELTIQEDFNHFLFDNGTSDKYVNYISSYIVTNEHDLDFVNKVNGIREGLILYQGIRYSSDNPDKWNTRLVLYINTEYLFALKGYDGILFKENVDYFIELLKEINHSEQLITLKYLPETEKEINRFFLSAESIVQKLQPLLPGKTAMETIVKKCSTQAEVVIERSSFYHNCHENGIELQEFEHDTSEWQDYNLECQGILNSLKTQNDAYNKKEGTDYKFSEKYCSHFLRIFTKINYFRKGNSLPFEKCGHIFVTDAGYAKYLGHNSIVTGNDRCTPFAKDMDFIITRFWLDLNKGFSTKVSFPKSFNVISKAKIILSSHLKASLSETFDELVKRKEQGDFSDEEAIRISHELKVKESLPENINSDSISQTIRFLTDDNQLGMIHREAQRKDVALKEKDEELKEKDEAFKEKDEELRKANEQIHKQQEQERIRKEDEEKAAKERSSRIEFENDRTKFVNDEWQTIKEKVKKNFLLNILIILFHICIVYYSFIIGSSKSKSPWLYVSMLIIAILATADLMYWTLYLKKETFSTVFQFVFKRKNYEFAQKTALKEKFEDKHG
jgi:hypothetical protein